MYFKKVDVVVLDDPIYGDDGFDLLFASEHKEKVITNESDVDEDVGGDIVGGSMRLSSSSDAYRSHNDPKGKSKIVFGQESVSPKVHPKVKSKFYVGDKGLPTKVERKGKSTDFVCEQNLSSHVVSQEITHAENKQAKPKCKSFRSTKSTALHIGRKCSTSKKFKKIDVIEFTKKAESRLRLPTDVSSHLCLSLDNLHHVTVQNEKCELLKLGTRREKSGKGFRYGYLLLIVKQIYKVFNMAESSSSIREPFFCRHMNGADEVLLAIPSDAASKLWGNDKAPKNVLIQSQDGRKFNVSLSEAKGKHFFFYGWSNVVKHLQLKKGCLVLFNPVDFSTFKVTHFIDGVFQSSFWTSMLSTTSNFIVIPESVLPNFYDYMSGDIISIIDVGNKIFHVKIETLFGKVGFSIGIDVIVNLFQLEDGCYLIFTRGFGNYFHLTILEKNGVEINYADVQVDEVSIICLLLYIFNYYIVILINVVCDF
uniref:Putative DNA-binding pseudobarrel domain-containing protein n=1 Tax=Helianthus annuus TaxID=4232 RepID=A0A251S6X5_HELAN